MRQITVEDVIVQTVVTLVNLGGRRLGLAGGPEERDVEQARQAIEAVRSLLPLMPAEDATAVRNALSQLQMAYAREARGEGAPTSTAGPSATPPQGPGEAAPGQGRSAAEDAERAKARAKIWTPGGR
jgi:hypothetical protein